jgi:hypothetical protein
MQEDKILTKHPQGKRGVNMSKTKYDQMKAALLSVLQGSELTHNELFNSLNQKLAGKFDGNIGWYGESLKLDLEARGLIERFGKNPQKYR